MPTYRYRCETCGDELEVWQSITDDALTEHDGCGGRLVKVLSPAGIVLKGSGFYKTDSRTGAKSNGSGGSKPSESKPGDGGSSKPDSGSSDSGGGSSGSKESKSSSSSGGSSGSGSSSGSSGAKGGSTS